MINLTADNILHALADAPDGVLTQSQLMTHFGINGEPEFPQLLSLLTDLQSRGAVREEPVVPTHFRYRITSAGRSRVGQN